MKADFYRHAARRYLHDRHSYWVGVYSALRNQGRREDDYHYSDDAKNTFPRYNVLAAIGVELDRLDPDRLPSSDDVLEWLRVAGGAAESLFTGSHEPGSIEAEAEDDERRRFIAFVNTLPGAEALEAAPLPYRRTLAADEARRWRESILEAWELDGPDFWEPLRTDVVRGRSVLALRAESFLRGNEPSGPASVAISEALHALGVSRIIELREYGPEFERESSTAEFLYTGAEGLFFSRDLEWLIFASHEGVTTLGGSNVEQLRADWPELGNFVWDELN
ncbi:MAG: hypothetical protein GY750_09805 [Lentisphaerae bacterium]|nr:hypothetical protein [Lentisphaerota bacterium]